MPSEDIKLPFSVKDPREFWIYVYIVTWVAVAAATGGKRESYRGGRMRLGEIEFAIIPSKSVESEEAHHSSSSLMIF